MNLDDMALFVEIARAGNFSRASERLGLANATLSRRVARMEKQLGVRLFERSTRRVALTEAATRFLERCAPLIDEARLAHEALHAGAVVPEGHLRVSMPVDLGVTYLGYWLPDFCRQHPGVTLDLDLSPRFTDLRKEPFDVAFRLGPVRGDGLVARRVGTVANGIYAAPAYLDRRGRPKTPDDLKSHTCVHIGSAQRGAIWQLSNGTRHWKVPVSGSVGLNSMSLMRLLVERGMGIGLLPVKLARPSNQAGALETVLPKYQAQSWPVFAVTTSRMQSATVRALIDFVRARLDS